MLCQTSYITATAPADPKGWGRVEQKIFCGSKQKIDSFTNINDKFSLSNISAAKLHAVEISACQIQAYIIKRVNSSVESYFRSSEILPGKLKFG